MDTKKIHNTSFGIMHSNIQPTNTLYRLDRYVFSSLSTSVVFRTLRSGSYCFYTQY